VSDHTTTDSHADPEHNELAHVCPKSILMSTGGILLFLTATTVWAARLDFGNVDLWVAMIIATIKATLVVLFFMHLRYDKPFHAVIFISSLVFVSIFIGFALMDNFMYQPSIEWQESLEQFKSP